ncbi:MAG TPA: hypothetical protein VK826_02820 [Bacteroidia bacterium]|nr:hypothetical protein [Bacteroidia bacterium]
MSEFFSHDHLKKLKAAEGHVLKNVVYHNWINNTQPGERFEFLEKLELDFGDYNLVITVPESMEDALTLADDFDGEKYRLQLLHEFGGKIDLRSDNMNDNVLWEPSVGKTLRLLGVEHQGDNVYSNHSIMLDFGEEKLEIRPGMDGVIVEPLDEV